MIKLKCLYSYLEADNVAIYENEIFEIIPELRCEKGFEQKSQWHCYDVWKHTLATINACDKNFENRLTLLLHDVGKPFSYQDDGEIRHFQNHADKSEEISREILNRLGVPVKYKENILRLIKMHSTKVNPANVLPEDLEFYAQLIKIQKCDAQGYEKVHSLRMLAELNDTENEINKLRTESENDLEI